MNVIIRKIIFAIAGLALAFGLSSCTEDPEYKLRQQQNKEAQSKNTLEKQNLQKRLELEEDANRIGYVYLVTFGKPFGYYVAKGKISSSGSQLDPEDLVNCGRGQNVPGGTAYSDYCEVIDGPQDDGTYGTGDPGIFFFTPDGTMVTTSLDYVYSTQPLPSALEVPKLG